MRNVDVLNQYYSYYMYYYNNLSEKIDSAIWWKVLFLETVQLALANNFFKIYTKTLANKIISLRIFQRLNRFQT